MTATPTTPPTAPPAVAPVEGPPPPPLVLLEPVSWQMRLGHAEQRRLVWTQLWPAGQVGHALIGSVQARQLDDIQGGEEMRARRGGGEGRWARRASWRGGGRGMRPAQSTGEVQSSTASTGAGGFEREDEGARGGCPLHEPSSQQRRPRLRQPAWHCSPALCLLREPLDRLHSSHLPSLAFAPHRDHPCTRSSATNCVLRRARRRAEARELLQHL